MTLRWSAPCAVLIATASACRSSDIINPDHCFILVAQLHLVQEGLVAEVHLERHDGDVQPRQHFRRQVHIWYVVI